MNLLRSFVQRLLHAVKTFQYLLQAVEEVRYDGAAFERLVIGRDITGSRITVIARVKNSAR